jgi:hypothetical protein
MIPVNIYANLSKGSDSDKFTLTIRISDFGLNALSLPSLKLPEEVYKNLC